MRTRRQQWKTFHESGAPWQASRPVSDGCPYQELHPAPSLPAGQIDKVVVDEIRCIGQDPDLLGETLRQARSQAEETIERLTAERRIIKSSLARCHAEIRRTATCEPANSAATACIADLTDQDGQSERR